MEAVFTTMIICSTLVFMTIRLTSHKVSLDITYRPITPEEKPIPKEVIDQLTINDKEDSKMTDFINQMQEEIADVLNEEEE